MSQLRDVVMLRQLRGGKDPRAPKATSRATLAVVPGGRALRSAPDRAVGRATDRAVGRATDRAVGRAADPTEDRAGAVVHVLRTAPATTNPVIALLRERSCHTRHDGVTVVSLVPGIPRPMERAGLSSVRKKAPLPRRPPPPPEPRSYLFPIACVVLAVFALVAYPAFTAMPAEAAAPAPATPAEEKVMVTLRTVPDGATVLRGDEELGTSPCDVELSAGEAVTLRLQKAGFAALEHELTPEVGMEPVDLTLEALPFVMSLRGVPEGAAVKVGETAPSDVTNVTLGTALAAPVTVTVSARGFHDFETTVAADAFVNEDARRFHALDITLEPRAARASRRPVTRAATERVEGLPVNPF